MPTILVADDNSNIQKMVTLAFGEQGYKVVAVGNGEAAVRKLAEVRPDVVLADVFMPVRSGYEVCEFIKKDATFFAIPVVLLVGAFDPLDEKEARRVGADGVLKKPFVPPDPLIAMVTALIEKTAKPQAAVEQPPQIPAAAAPPVAPAAPLEFQAPSDEEERTQQFGVTRGPFSLRGEDGGDDATNHEFARPNDPTEDSGEHEDENATTWRRETALHFEVPERDSGMVVEPDERSLQTSSAQSESAEACVAAGPSTDKTGDEEHSQVAHDPSPETGSKEWMDFMSGGETNPESRREEAPVETAATSGHPEEETVASQYISAVEHSTEPETPADPEPRDEPFLSPHGTWQPEQPGIAKSQAGIPEDAAVFQSNTREAHSEESHPYAGEPPEQPSETAEALPQPAEKELGFAAWNFGIDEPARDEESDSHATAPHIHEELSKEALSALQHAASGESDLSHLPSLGEVQSFPAPPLADPAAVEAIVQKVLERLEPMLHDMLAKEILKPLVQNLLEQELQRK
ncbi:MAG: response regulator [Candidatus Acidiferrales bacterium]